MSGASPETDLVSVVIPAFNAEATVGATVRSVCAQSWRNLQIIIVDDGSRDDTATVAERAAAGDPRVRIVSQANAGVAAARNAGIGVARGAHVATIDADDLWHPRKIELQMEVVRRSARRLGFVYAWSRRIDPWGRVAADLGRPRHRGDVYDTLVAGNFLRNASCPLIPRDAILEAGGFDTSLRAAGAQGAEDLELYLRLARRDPVDLAPYFLVGYRSSPSGMSRSVPTMARSIGTVLAGIEGRGSVTEGVLDLARLNYDLYFAKLALEGGSAMLFAKHLGRAFTRDAGLTANLLATAAAGRAYEALAAAQGLRRFEDLDPAAPAFHPRFGDRLETILHSATRRRRSGEHRSYQTMKGEA